MFKFKVIYQQGTWPYSNLSKRTYLPNAECYEKIVLMVIRNILKEPCHSDNQGPHK